MQSEILYHGLPARAQLAGTGKLPVIRVVLMALLLVGSAHAATPVNISVDSDKPGPTIPATFTGLSFETKLMYADDQGRRYFRPDNTALIAMFKTLGIRSLRIGGNTADKTDLPMPSDADIDSLFQFAKAANVKVLYTLRLKGNPEPTEAAKAAKYIWSKYTDNVECFAIGNEPNVYVKTTPEYIALMQKYMDAIDSPDCAPAPNSPAREARPEKSRGPVSWSTSSATPASSVSSRSILIRADRRGRSPSRPPGERSCSRISGTRITRSSMTRSSHRCWSITLAIASRRPTAFFMAGEKTSAIHSHPRCGRWIL